MFQAAKTDLPNQDTAAESSDSNLPWLTSDILPLIYIDCANFRLFIPQCGDISKEKPAKNVFTPYDHDILMLQIASIHMTPQVSISFMDWRLGP